MCKCSKVFPACWLLALVFVYLYPHSLFLTGGAYLVYSTRACVWVFDLGDFWWESASLNVFVSGFLWVTAGVWAGVSAVFGRGLSFLAS